MGGSAGGCQRPPVRVRGIYATALTKLLLDSGIEISQPSSVVARRAGIAQNSLPAKVTIKDSEESRNALLVVGEAECFDEVFSLLKSELDSSFFSASELELYSTISVELVGPRGGVCVGKFGPVELEVEARFCTPGKVVKAVVVRAPPTRSEAPAAREGVAVLKDTLVVNSWGGVSASKHIKDEKRLELLAELAGEALKEGFGVRWRSNAGVVSEELLRRELAEAVEEAKRLKEELPSGGGEVLSRGERLGLAVLSSIDKRKLDEKRNELVPTIPYHHTLKSAGGALEHVVGYAELLAASGFDRALLGRKAFEYALELIAERGSVRLRQLYPEGRAVVVGPAKVVKVDAGSSLVVLERVLRGRGVYDGLGVPKEPGDRALTLLLFDALATVHVYESASGELKGVYVNVNTPPEPAGEGEVAYLDLHVDVVKRPDSSPEVVDREKLEEAAAKGLISAKLRERALEAALAVAKALSSLRSPGEHKDLELLAGLITSATSIRA